MGGLPVEPAMNAAVTRVLGAGLLAIACGASSRQPERSEGSSGTTGGVGAPNGGSGGDKAVSTGGTGNETAEGGRAGEGDAGRGGDTGSNANGGGAGTMGVAGTAGSGGMGGQSAGGTDALGGAGASGNAAGGTAGSADGGAGAAGGNSSAGNGGAGETGGEENTIGWIGCSLSNNVADGYARIGGTRMWWGSGFTNPTLVDYKDQNSRGWMGFDDNVQRYGLPTGVWIQICAYEETPTMQDVIAVVAIVREHAAPRATIYITGMPLYVEGHVCPLFEGTSPELTDRLAREAAEDPNLGLIYPGVFGPLEESELSGDGCHTTAAGGNRLGEQALGFWG
jgi:hypothetical protein